MSGQSNDCLRVCNDKMKFFYQDGNGTHFLECMGYTAVATSNFNFFNRIAGDHQSSCCRHILVSIK